MFCLLEGSKKLVVSLVFFGQQHFHLQLIAKNKVSRWGRRCCKKERKYANWNQYIIYNGGHFNGLYWHCRSFNRAYTMSISYLILQNKDVSGSEYAPTCGNICFGLFVCVFFCCPGTKLIAGSIHTFPKGHFCHLALLNGVAARRQYHICLGVSPTLHCQFVCLLNLLVGCWPCSGSW